MGKVTRGRYAADFKAKVALEAIRGELTLAELSAKHGIHQTMIAAWKKQATGCAIPTSSAGRLLLTPRWRAHQPPRL